MPQTVHVYPNNDLIEHDTDIRGSTAESRS